MSEYTKRLHKFVNGDRFVRTFYGECPSCGKRVFSVGDDAVPLDGSTVIKAKFMCPCGKKWKEIVYSKDLKKYKYRQTLPEDYKDPKFGKVKVLRLGNRLFLILPDKILSKEVRNDN